MKKYLKIAFFLAILPFPAEAFPQEKQNAIQIDAQDDLGNVTDAFQENFFEALKQKAIENHEKAIDALIKCLTIDSSKPVVYLELGKNYNALEEYDEAAMYLEKARKAEPENEAVLSELYQSYFLNQQFEKALSVVEELKEQNAAFSEDLANLYAINEKYDDALELLDELDEQWGNSEFRNGLRNQIYAKTGNVQAHIEDLEKRVEDEPQNEQNYLNLIFVYSEEGDSKKAFEMAKKLQEMNPSSELVHLALYKFYLTDKNSGEAVNSIKVIFESEEIDQETKLKVLNDFLIFVSLNPGLEEELMEVVQIFSQDEGSTEIYGKLGEFLLESNQKERALDFFEMALSQGIVDFGILRSALVLQLELDKPEAAKELSKRALESYPSQPLIYLFNGTALNELGSFKEAEEILDFGLDFLIGDPQMEVRFYEQLAIAHTGIGNEQKAAEFKDKASETEKSIIDE